MRPLKLSFTAFGSYLHSTSISFADLNTHHLFVISGPTGAGKSTLYDAITYALFGQGNGKGRIHDRIDLRNQMADNKTKTSVELEFEYKSKVYRVKREFNYHGDSDQCEFQWLQQGLWQDIVVENSRMTSYNKKIQEVLGITAEQFRQIVILPQGEYEEFLTSDSNDKMGVLRSIFATDRLNLVVDDLRQHVKQLNEQIKQYQHAKDTILALWRTNFGNKPHTATHQVLLHGRPLDEQLLTAVQSDLQQFHADQSHIDNDLRTIEEQIKQWTQDIQRYALQNQHMKEYQQASTRFMELQVQAPHMEQLSVQIQLTQAVRPLLSQEQALSSQQSLRSSNEHKLQEAKGLLLEVEKRYLENEKLQREVEQWDAENRDNVAAQFILDQHQESIGHMEKLEIDMKGLTSRITQAEQEEKQMNVELNEMEHKREIFTQEQQSAQQHMQVVLYILRKLQATYSRKLDALQHNFTQSQEDKELIRTIYDEFITSYQQDLHQLQLFGQWDQDQIQSKVHELMQQSNQEGKNISDTPLSQQLLILQDSIETVSKQLQEVKEDIIMNRNQMMIKQEQYQQHITKLTELLESSQPTVALYQQKQRNLTQRITSITNQIQILNKQIELQTLGFEKQKNTVQILQNQSEEMTKQVKWEQDQFDLQLSQSVFIDKDAYLDARNNLPQLDHSVNTLATFNADRDLTAETMSTLSKVLNGQLQMIDLEPLQKQLEEQQLIQRDASISLGSLREMIQNVTTQYIQFQDNVAQSIEQDQQLIPAQELLDVLRGGTRQISFENHMLTYHFKEILGFANQRLMHMVNNRYELKLKDELGKNTEALDLYVFDHQTGQTRPVQTLSGGEKFMASLALGLGAADSIQSNRGGVEMNMMFIDEGFGTLDVDRLEDAIRVLHEISTDRLVGVISHRSELKDQIAARIEVTNRDGISSLIVQVHD